MRVGWIGTGVMGGPMCQQLISKWAKRDPSREVYVYNRTASKAEPVVRAGGIPADPSHMAKTCDIIFMMLGYPADVRSVALGGDEPNKGILHCMGKGSIVVDHTTSSPALARLIHDEAQKRGITSVDAPVSGGDVGAREGRLVIMVGGADSTKLETIMPLMDCYSRACQLMGTEPGSGQHAKLANQLMISSTMVGLCEGLIYAHKAGLSVKQLIDLLKDGAAGSFSLSAYGPRIVKRDFAPGFFVKHFVKDLGIALEEARRMELALPGSALATQLYSSLLAHKKGDLGTQSLILALEQLNNVQLG